jgi:hypothetical protein
MTHPRPPLSPRSRVPFWAGFWIGVAFAAVILGVA